MKWHFPKPPFTQHNSRGIQWASMMVLKFLPEMTESFLLYLLAPILGNKIVSKPQLQNSKKQFELFK